MGLSVAVIRLFRLSGENIQKNWMTMIPEAAVEYGHVLNGPVKIYAQIYLQAPAE